MKPLYRYIIALVLLAHGIGHIMPFMAAWTSVPMGFSNTSWIFSDGVAVSSLVGQIFGLFGLVALIGFVAGSVGLLTHKEWWRPLLIASAIISIMVIVPWWSAWPVGSMLGALLVDAAVLVALLPHWGSQLAHAM